MIELTLKLLLLELDTANKSVGRAASAAGSGTQEDAARLRDAIGRQSSAVIALSSYAARLAQSASISGPVGPMLSGVSVSGTGGSVGPMLSGVPVTGTGGPAREAPRAVAEPLTIQGGPASSPVNGNGGNVTFSTGRGLKGSGLRIRFLVDKTEVLRLEVNGDIFYREVLVENDRDVVSTFQAFLFAHLPDAPREWADEGVTVAAGAGVGGGTPGSVVFEVGNSIDGTARSVLALALSTPGINEGSEGGHRAVAALRAFLVGALSTVLQCNREGQIWPGFVKVTESP